MGAALAAFRERKAGPQAGSFRGEEGSSQREPGVPPLLEGSEQGLDVSVADAPSPLDDTRAAAGASEGPAATPVAVPALFPFTGVPASGPAPGSGHAPQTHEPDAVTPVFAPLVRRPSAQRAAVATEVPPRSGSGSGLAGDEEEDYDGSDEGLDGGDSVSTLGSFYAAHLAVQHREGNKELDLRASITTYSPAPRSWGTGPATTPEPSPGGTPTGGTPNATPSPQAGPVAWPAGAGCPPGCCLDAPNDVLQHNSQRDLQHESRHDFGRGGSDECGSGESDTVRPRGVS